MRMGPMLWCSASSGRLSAEGSKVVEDCRRSAGPHRRSRRPNVGTFPIARDRCAQRSHNCDRAASDSRNCSHRAGEAHDRPNRRDHQILPLDSAGVESSCRASARTSNAGFSDEYKPDKTPIMTELPPAEQRKTHVFNRGSFLNPGEEVSPDTPHVFPPFAADLPRNRLGLAKWLVDRKQSADRASCRQSALGTVFR